MPLENPGYINTQPRKCPLLQQEQEGSESSLLKTPCYKILVQYSYVYKLRGSSKIRSGVALVEVNSTVFASVLSLELLVLVYELKSDLLLVALETWKCTCLSQNWKMVRHQSSTGSDSMDTIVELDYFLSQWSSGVNFWSFSSLVTYWWQQQLCSQEVILPDPTVLCLLNKSLLIRQEMETHMLIEQISAD